MNKNKSRRQRKAIKQVENPDIFVINNRRNLDGTLIKEASRINAPNTYQMIRPKQMIYTNDLEFNPDIDIDLDIIDDYYEEYPYLSLDIFADDQDHNQKMLPITTAENKPIIDPEIELEIYSDSWFFE